MNDFGFQVILDDADLTPDTVRIRIFTMRTFDPFAEWLGPYLAEGGGDWLECFTKMIPATTQCVIQSKYLTEVRKVLGENGYAEITQSSGN